MQKTGICLTESDINDYLCKTVTDEKRKTIEEHLKDCGECMEKLVFSYRTVKEFDNQTQKEVKCMKPTQKKNLWLVGAIAAFLLSFFASRYFIQFLVAAIMLSLKWIFDTTNARILIMIYEAWKKGGEKETSKILSRFRDR